MGTQLVVGLVHQLLRVAQELAQCEPTDRAQLLDTRFHTLISEAAGDEILTALEHLNAEGLTLVVVTHDSAVATRARRRLRLDRGAIHDITR